MDEPHWRAVPKLNHFNKLDNGGELVARSRLLMSTGSAARQPLVLLKQDVPALLPKRLRCKRNSRIA